MEKRYRILLAARVRTQFLRHVVFLSRVSIAAAKQLTLFSQQLLLGVADQNLGKSYAGIRILGPELDDHQIVWLPIGVWGPHEGHEAASGHVRGAGLQTNPSEMLTSNCLAVPSKAAARSLREMYLLFLYS